MRADLAHWTAWWNTAGAKGDSTATYTVLASAYAEKHRRYHTLKHIAHRLSEFDRMRELCPRSGCRGDGHLVPRRGLSAAQAGQ
jgi:predicted metal-dependent HD superfamily phosphohydrolase